jgi:DNA polymerase
MSYDYKTADEETGYLGDPMKTGLWGYAENMGVQMTQEQAAFVVRMFREAYREIPDMWKILEKAIFDVLKAPKTVREVGPNGCIRIDKLVTKSGRTILRIKLPSGRYLHYVDAEIMEVKKKWQDADGNDVYGDTFCYKGQNQTTKQWTVIESWGGKVFENIVQAIARDILANSLVRFDTVLDLPICAHVHDEGVSETSRDPFLPGVREMEFEMSQPIDDYPGLPLKADGFESPYYHK